jgi:hypothetical protein
MSEWNEALIARAISLQTLARKCVVLVPNCNWTGHECGMTDLPTCTESQTCPDCTAAAESAWHGFTHGCPGCAARAVSRGPNYRESHAAGKQTRKYRAELEMLGVSHQQVLEAAAADALGKEMA